MTTLLRYPSPALTFPSLLVDHWGFDLKPITDELVKIRNQTDDRGVNALALAAPQIGVNLQIFVWRDTAGADHFVCNPEILETDGTQFDDEQCLSFLGPLQIRSSVGKQVYSAGLEFQVARADRIKVRYQDHEGKFELVETSGLVSRMFQHEIDHLHGKTYLDRVSKQMRKQAIKRWAKIHPDNEQVAA